MGISKLSFILLVLALASCNNKDDQAAGHGVSRTYKIFATDTVSSGDAGGVAAIDDICMADANKPADSSVYKALIGASTRAAPSTDWPLKASTTYVAVDGTTEIGTTTSGAVFSFPLTNAIDSSIFNIWTGLNPDWSTDSNNCTDWTSNSSVIAGGSGLAINTDNLSIGAGDSLNCASTIAFYCVEQ